MAIYNYQTVTIASSGDTSGAIDLQGHTLVGVRLPSAMTGTTISVLESDSVAGTYTPISPAGAGTTYTSAASQTIGIPAGSFACANFVKIKSGSSEGAARTITVISRVIK